MTNSTLMVLKVMILWHQLFARRIVNSWTLEAAHHDPRVKRRRQKRKKKAEKREK